jgi:outer membrane immunogenic protein
MRLARCAALAAVAVVGFASVASAAPPNSNWTGWYIGLNAGGGWGNNDSIKNTVTSSYCNPIFAGCVIAPVNGASTALAAAVPTDLGIHPHGFIGGGQIGYNWQFAPQWVAGIEADFQGADIKGSGNATNTAKALCCGDSTIVTGTGTQKLDWFGTLRGRLGWLPTQPLLLFVTGGLAYGHIETDTSFSATGINPGGFGGTVTASDSSTRVGWTVGGGLEWMFAPHWSVKGEYLYYDLGHVTLNQTLTEIAFAAALPLASVGVSSEAHYNGSIARVGVNYKF